MIKNIKNNKVIAEFMNPKENTESINYNHKRLQYHSSWDWLMPVVEKIKKENVYTTENISDTFIIFINNSLTVIGGNNGGYYFKSEGKDMLSNTYKTVVKFIKWYNKNNKKEFNNV